MNLVIAAHKLQKQFNPQSFFLCELPCLQEEQQPVQPALGCQAVFSSALAGWNLCYSFTRCKA